MDLPVPAYIPPLIWRNSLMTEFMEAYRKAEWEDLFQGSVVLDVKVKFIFCFKQNGR